MLSRRRHDMIMPSAQLRTVVAVLGLVALHQQAKAQTAIKPDSARTIRFAEDSAFGSIILRQRILEIRAEQSPGPPVVRGASRATGRFAVYSVWPGERRQIAVRLDPAYGAPTVALVADGEPSVVVLSSYTGGLGAQGIPAYSLKIIILERAPRSFTVDEEAPGTALGTAVIESFSRTGNGFRLQVGPALVLTYDGRQLVSRTH
jgi:hypothetical protein